MYIKQVLLYTDKKKSSIYVTHVMEALKETKDKIGIQFLRNDIQLHKWDFLDEMVLEDTLDFEFYSYINVLLQMKSERQEQCLMKQKYEAEITQIKEVTNVTNEPLLFTLLKKGNFNVNNCVNMIFAMSEEEMDALKKEVEARQQKNEKNDELESAEEASVEEEITNEESNDEEISIEDNSDEDSINEDSSDEESNDEESSDEESSDEENSNEKSSDEENSDEESSDEESNDEISSEEESESDETKGEIIQLDEIDIISGNVDYIPDVISILKEKKRKKKTKKINKDQKDDEDVMKEEEKKKIKERIIELLNRSDSSEPASIYLEEDIENDMIFPVPFSEDFVEEMETIADEDAIPDLRRTNEEECDEYEVGNDEQIETGEEEQQQKSSKEQKGGVTFAAKEKFHERKHDLHSNYNHRKYNEQSDKGKNEIQNNYKKLDNHQGRNRHNYGKVHFNKPDNNRSRYSRSYFNRPNYNKHDFNKKWENVDEQTVEQKGNDVPTQSLNTSSTFRNNRNFHTFKKNDAHNETDKNLDKEKEKRQYAKKRMTAGKNYRKQYDKKMSRGMF